MKASQVFRATVLVLSVLFTTLAGSATLPVQVAASESTPVARVHGHQPFLFILCKLAGEPAEPEARAFFENMLLGPNASLDDYWRQVSFGQIDLEGSGVAGWYTLPETAASYASSDGQVDRERLAAACMKLAEADHDLSGYAALGLVFNADLESQPKAGQACIDKDGRAECHKVIWMWQRMLRQQATWAHEMGHIFGLPHSTDASNDPYANVWDVMSGATGCTDGAHSSAIGQYPIADQLDRLGWISAARKLVVGPDASTRVELQGLANGAGSGYLLARVPVQGSSRYYTVEARVRVGYDVHTPADAVVIHAVDPADIEHPAHLVTHPGAPLNAIAGIWRPGQVYSDHENRISISVDGRTADGFRVTIRTGSQFGDQDATTGQETENALPHTALLAQTASVTAQGPDGEVFKVREERNGRDWDIYVTEYSADGNVVSDRRINDDNGKTWQGSPSIAADGAGNVHVVWVDRRSGDSEIYAATRSANGGWGRNVRLAAAGIDDYASPTLIVDERGHAHAAWIAYPSCGRAKGMTGTLMATAHGEGDEWQPAVMVRDWVEGGKDARLALAVDEAGVVDLAW